MLEVLVLGSVRVRAEGSDFPVPGAKQRVLTARLALAHGRPVRSDQLIDDLWDEDAPRNPVHALQAQISRLRSALPVGIEFLDDGYRFDPSTFQTDAAQFESMCEKGGWLLADGDLNQASECLDEALGLWRGEAFAGLHAVTALQTEAVRLTRLHAAALADRVDVDLALGQSAALVPELHALVEKQPFHERHVGQLMTALYSSGNALEALEVFSRARETFADTLGVEPSGELCGLHTQILRREHPESLLRLPVAGPVLGDSGGEPGVAVGASSPVVTSNRPDALVTLLRNHRALLLTGPAGMGKTHLLRTLAASFEAQHSLAPLLAASALSKTVPLGVFVGAVGSDSGDWMSPAALVDYFARQRSRAVLLVDNVNELDEASLFVVTHLIRSSGLPAVLTSRDLDGVPDEIQALYDSGDLTHATVDALTDTDADELASHLLGGPLTPDTRPRIVDVAQGNPLHLREIITGSLDDGRLVHTEHGWELRGTPAPTPRLAQWVGERFDGLDEDALEAASRVAIAGEYPIDALETRQRRVLARSDVLDFAGRGWLRLSHPLDGEFLRARCSEVLWHELIRDVVQVLNSSVADGRPEARRRAHVLALDLDDPIDITATIALAEHALGSFDERLALRAAEAVVARLPTSVDGHRVAAQAASSLRMSEVADAHFDQAYRSAVTGAEQTTVALARGRHLGLQNHDAAGALKLIEDTLAEVDGPDEVAHLHRARMRWAAVAGHGGETARAPDEASDAATALGMITVGISGVITGPIEDAHRVLLRLRDIPDGVIDLVPGGAALIELTAVMALSNSGDVVATRKRLQQMITRAQDQGPEAIGMWEYALGFSHLLSGNAGQAYEFGQSAAAHLAWRDAAGLLPAAQALAAAGAQATSREDEAQKLFDAVLPIAAQDPKVVMLRAWADAWQAKSDRRDDDAALTLVNAAQWMLAAQHTFFAGMLAHCAVRVGRQLVDAVAVLREAEAIAGGGLLDLFVRHGDATLARDQVALEVIAGDARELGLATTAADTWLTLLRPLGADSFSVTQERHLRTLIDQVSAETPMMALWSAPGGCYIGG